ncbi:unnamed protein product [Caenorhabditis angaria]|uniref:Uncharacterized protein n=1 Tax=Caenorhabditis angaria TaxID=860376 RepID=A0A9P1IDF9_9PELO|nr:unnamed protein product [Caenorhabditis angaria]
MNFWNLILNQMSYLSKDAKKLKLIKHLDVVINDHGKLFIERSITLKSIKWHKNRLINFEFVVEPIQKQSNVETLVKRSQELESKFVDFITKRSDIPIEQFGQIWLWNLFASIYNIDSTIDIQSAFAVFLNRLRSDIPIEQFGQIWLWNLFASIYNIDSTIDIQSAFAVFLNRLWFQPIEADIKLKFMRYFKMKIDFIIKDFITSYHDVNLTPDDDNKINGWTHMNLCLCQPEKYVDEFGETQTQAPPNSLEDTEDSIMLKIIKKATKNVKKSDEK